MPWVAKAILSKKNNEKVIIVPHLKTHYRDVGTKTSVYLHKNGHIDK